MVPVFYDKRMVADSKGYSPSAAKPEKVVADWQAGSLPIEIVKFEPVAVADLFQAHSMRYANGVMRGVIQNGHGNHERAIAVSCLWTVGSFVAAARHALEHGVACSPSSGFHHAGVDFGGGFCTFNGLMVAAMDLIANERVEGVAILDMDYHYGDGTEDIIESRHLKHQVSHATGLDAESLSDHYIEDTIDWLLSESDAGILFYQAGADQHIDDPLGGIFTTEQLLERDRRVFEHCKKLDIPVVWCLAGGYQREPDGSIPKVLEIHRNTMRACVAAHAVEV